MDLLNIERVLQARPKEGGRNFFETYSLLKTRLLENEYTQTSAEFEGGNDHGPGHIRRILKKLDDIVGEAPLEHLNTFELWLTMTAVLYHDVGLLQARDGHPRIGSEILLTDTNSYIFDRHERDLIQTAIITHGSRSQIEEQCKRYPKKHKVGDFTVNPRLVCALVRLADELDEDYRRGDEELYKKRRIAERYPESAPYWLFSQRITGIDIDAVGREQREIRFNIAFDAPDLELVVKGKNGEAIPFVAFALDKFLKINKERRYCSSFLPEALAFSHIMLTFLPGAHSSWDVPQEIVLDDRADLNGVLARLPEDLRNAAVPKTTVSVQSSERPHEAAAPVSAPPVSAIAAIIAKSIEVTPPPPSTAGNVAAHGPLFFAEQPVARSEAQHQSSPIALRVVLPFERQHAAVRIEERKTLRHALDKRKICWLSAEWGLGRLGFLCSCLTAPGSEPVPVVAFRIDYGEVLKRSPDSDRSAQMAVVLSELEALGGRPTNSLILVDGIPQDEAFAVSANSPTSAEVETFAQMLVDALPSARVVLSCRCSPYAPCFPLVQLRPLDEVDCQRYIGAHPAGEKGVQSSALIERLYVKSEGIPLYLDWTLRQLRGVSIDDIPDTIDQDTFLQITNIEAVPEALGEALASLQNSGDKYTRRSLKLLKTLVVLSCGETLPMAQELDVRAIQRLDQREPFFSFNVEQLTALGLISIAPLDDVEAAVRDAPRNPRLGAPKLLIVSKQIRDYVRYRILSEEEHRLIARKALDQFFGDKWRDGEPALGWITRIEPRARLFDAQMGPGNPYIVIAWLMRDAAERDESAAFGQFLAMGEAYAIALLRADRYRDVHVMCSEMIRILDTSGHANAAARVSFIHGQSLRMIDRYHEAIAAHTRALSYTADGISNNWRARVHLELSDSNLSLGNREAGREHAKEALALCGAESGPGYHAQFNLIRSDDEIDLASSRQKLRRLEAKARNNRHLITANNIVIYLTDQISDPALRIQLRKTVLSSKHDDYNLLRALVAHVSDLIAQGRDKEITEADVRALRTGYSYLLQQRMDPLFERCHDVLWTLEKRRQRYSVLKTIFRYSSALWRFIGNVPREQEHRKELWTLVPSEPADEPPGLPDPSK